MRFGIDREKEREKRKSGLALWNDISEGAAINQDKLMINKLVGVAAPYWVIVYRISSYKLPTVSNIVD